MSEEKNNNADLVSDQAEMDNLIKEFKEKGSSGESNDSDSLRARREPREEDFIPEDYDPLEDFFAKDGDANLDFTVLDTIQQQERSGQATIYDERRHDFLGFELANEHYAINIMEIKEIITYREISEVPRAPVFLPGIISIRGEIIPIVDLRKRLKLECNELSRDARILVVVYDEESFGLIVDRVTSVSRIVENDIETPPTVIGGIEAKFIEGVGRLENGVLIILNVDAVLRFALNEIG